MFSPLKMLPEYTLCLGRENDYVAVNTSGIFLLDKTTFEVKRLLLDFFGASFGFLSYDNRFLVLGNARLGIRVYDLTVMKNAGSFLPTASKPVYLMGMDISPDQKHIYVIMNEAKDPSIPPIFFDDFLSNSQSSLCRLTFPDLKEEGRFSVKEHLSDFAYLPFLGKYMTLSNQGEYYLLEADNELTKANLQTKGRDIICFDQKKLFATLTDIGIRLYDERFEEQNKFDILPDEKETVSTSMFGYENNLPVANDDSSATKEIYRERIEWVRALDENRFIVLISDSMGAYQRFQVISFSDGHVIDEWFMGQVVNNPNVLDAHHISFYSNTGLVIMEVKDDRE